MLLGLFTTRKVACEVRHNAGQAASLAASECHALSSELGDLQAHEAARKLQCCEDVGESREQVF